MYAVVGCSECAALWIVEGRPDTSECPRCGHRREFEKRRTFHRTDDANEAREVRGRLLAARQEEDDAFAGVDAFAELDARLDEAGVDDETYLEASGLDAAAVADAGDRATGSPERPSRIDTVRAAVRELDEPTDEAIRAYCDERGVSSAFVEKALGKLVRAGEVTAQGETYRLV